MGQTPGRGQAAEPTPTATMLTDPPLRAPLEARSVYRKKFKIKHPKSKKPTEAQGPTIGTLDTLSDWLVQADLKTRNANPKLLNQIRAIEEMLGMPNLVGEPWLALEEDTTVEVSVHGVSIAWTSWPSPEAIEDAYEAWVEEVRQLAVSEGGRNLTFSPPTPTRDGRGGWSGDAHAEWESSP